MHNQRSVEARRYDHTLCCVDGLNEARPGGVECRHSRTSAWINSIKDRSFSPDKREGGAELATLRFRLCLGKGPPRSISLLYHLSLSHDPSPSLAAASPRYSRGFRPTTATPTLLALRLGGRLSRRDHHLLRRRRWTANAWTVCQTAASRQAATPPSRRPRLFNTFLKNFS